MNRTTTLNTPRLVGAFVLALGLLVAGLAVGLGPAGAVMDSGGEEPSVTEALDVSSAQTTAASSPSIGTGGGTVLEAWGCDGLGCWCDTEADCLEVSELYPECGDWDFVAEIGTFFCELPDYYFPEAGGEDGGGSSSPEVPGPLGPGDLPGAENTGTPTEPEQPENPGTPEPPETPEQPPTGPPPGIDPGKVLDPGDLPGTVDPGPRSGSADSGKGLDLPGVMS